MKFKRIINYCLRGFYTLPSLSVLNGSFVMSIITTKHNQFKSALAIIAVAVMASAIVAVAVILLRRRGLTRSTPRPF